MKSLLLMLSILNSLCGKAVYQKSKEAPVIFHSNHIGITKSNRTNKGVTNLDTTKFVYAEFVYQYSHFAHNMWVTGKAVSSKIVEAVAVAKRTVDVLDIMGNDG